MAICGPLKYKSIFFDVMTESRELTNYCQESVSPSHSRRYADALNNIDVPEALDLIVRCVKSDAQISCSIDEHKMFMNELLDSDKSYLNAMNIIESTF